MLRFCALAAGAAVLVVAACSSFSGEPSAGPSDAGADVAVAETSTPVPDTDAGQVMACPTALPLPPDPTDLLDEDFSTSGCDGWVPLGSKIESVKTPCGFACRVCLDGPPATFNVLHGVPLQPDTGNFEVSGWMLSDDADDAGVGATATYKLDTTITEDLVTGEPSPDSAIGGFPLVPRWIRVSQMATAPTNKSSTATLYFNGQTPAPNACFLLTNVRVQRLPAAMLSDQ